MKEYMQKARNECSRSAGTGIQSGLKIRCPIGHEGSTPFSGISCY